MIRIRTYALAIAFTGLLFTSCKKEGDKTIAPTRENLAGSYILVSIKYKTSSTPEVEVKDEILDDCQKDDIFTLNSNMSFTYVDAGVQCDPSGSYSDNWVLEGNTISFDMFEMPITKFDGKTLVGSTTEVEGGISFTYTITFSKQ